MGIGYVIGCMLSILLWQVDRAEIFRKFNNKIESIVKNKVLLTLLYLIVIVLIWRIGRVKITNNFLNETINVMVTFFVLDISNTERKNLKREDKVFFYNSISSISKSLVCGFIAPFLYMFIFGKSIALIYVLIFQLSSLDELYLFEKLWLIMNIIPSAVANIFLYLIYVLKFKKIKIKADYAANFIIRPLLNVDITAAYIEGLNFYYYYTEDYSNYIKNYGTSNRKIDKSCIKHYLGLEYTICMIVFMIFFFYMSFG